MQLLEIEKELAGLDAAAALARYDAQLLALAGRAKAARNKGLPRGEFERCAALENAVTLARKLLRLQLRK